MKSYIMGGISMASVLGSMILLNLYLPVATALTGFAGGIALMLFVFMKEIDYFELGLHK